MEKESSEENLEEKIIEIDSSKIELQKNKEEYIKIKEDNSDNMVILLIVKKIMKILKIFLLLNII